MDILQSELYCRKQIAKEKIAKKEISGGKHLWSIRNYSRLMCRKWSGYGHGTQTDVWITLGEEDLEEVVSVSGLISGPEVGDGGGDGGTSVALVTVSSRLVTGPLTLMMWVFVGAPTASMEVVVVASCRSFPFPVEVAGFPFPGLEDSTAITVVTWGGEEGLVDVEDLEDEVIDDLDTRWLLGEAAGTEPGVTEPRLRPWMGEGEAAGNLSLVDEARLRLSSSVLSRWSSLDLEDSNLSRSSSPLWWK